MPIGQQTQAAHIFRGDLGAGVLPGALFHDPEFDALHSLKRGSLLVGQVTLLHATPRQNRLKVATTPEKRTDRLAPSLPHGAWCGAAVSSYRLVARPGRASCQLIVASLAATC